MVRFFSVFYLCLFNCSKKSNHAIPILIHIPLSLFIVHCSSLSNRVLVYAHQIQYYNHKIIAFNFFPLFFSHPTTREALPRLDNYRLSLRTFKRPSISLLHGEVLEHITVSFTRSLFFFSHFWSLLLWIKAKEKSTGFGSKHHKEQLLLNSFLYDVLLPLLNSYSMFVNQWTLLHVRLTFAIKL